ncbi:hypothetical protein EDWATA_03056 [Edwardsiella tarda ATCC 23685]|uniref:Uncharacterized protein n=1 Tax=Edwardsiella tarda ATCC 23685 TaxID=500638 RepID=D4F8G3_EDWTA|nr:hypothetical protein EDWATA_03056 [Edwardsiella tarda ATCC 23685]
MYRISIGLAYLIFLFYCFYSIGYLKLLAIFSYGALWLSKC